MSSQEIPTGAVAAMRLERSPLLGLDLRERAVRELVDRVHVGQDRAIMRHHDGALILRLHFLADQLSDLLAAIRVQARGRLIRQDQLRAADEGASDRCALLLATRHLARVLGVGGLDPQVLHESADLGLTCGLVLLPLELGDELELIADAHVGEQLVVLEDEAQQLQALARPLLLAELGQLLAGDGDAPLVGRQQQTRNGQERRLSGTRRPQDRHELAGVDAQAEATQHAVRLVAVGVGLSDRIQFDDCHFILRFRR